VRPGGHRSADDWPGVPRGDGGTVPRIGIWLPARGRRLRSHSDRHVAGGGAAANLGTAPGPRGSDMIVVPIAVAGFASGGMLLWGAAAAIPIMLHFLCRRRRVVVTWGAMALLMRVVEREARRVRLEQLLLLLLRTLILLTLAAAL